MTAMHNRTSTQTASHIAPNIKDYDVAIVGGGMVGLSMALLLAKQNIASRIAIIETHTVESSAEYSPSFDARSTAVSAGSIEILSHLGLWAAIEPQACAIRQVKVSDKGHLGRTSYDQALNQGQALGAVVENACLGKVLVAAVLNEPAISLLAPAQLESLTPVAGGYDLHFSGDLPEPLQSEVKERASRSAALVILANGSDSRFAKQLGIEFDRHNYHQHALIANIEHSQPHQGQAFERFTEQGPLALLPISACEGKHRSALVWTQPDSQIEAMLALSDTNFSAALHQQFGYALGHFQKIGARASYSLSLVFAREQVRSSLVLLGNAAHFLHPVAGQGFNLALRDCVELSARLLLAKSEGRALGQLQDLQNYIAARKHDQCLTTELSHRFIDMFASGNPVKQMARNMALLSLQNCSGLNSLFFQQMMGRGGRGVHL